MTDAERKRLDEIANEASHLHMPDLDQQFLIGLCRRLEKLETIIPTFITDRAADEDWLVERDCAVRDETAKMTARECVKVAQEVDKGLDSRGALQAALGIQSHFGFDVGPTLTERVERETAAACIEIAEQVALDEEVAGSQASTIANAIRETFGFTAGVPLEEYTVTSHFAIPPTAAELDAAAGFPASLDNEIYTANTQAHDEAAGATKRPGG